MSPATRGLPAIADAATAAPEAEVSQAASKPAGVDLADGTVPEAVGRRTVATARTTVPAPLVRIRRGDPEVSGCGGRHRGGSGWSLRRRQKIPAPPDVPATPLARRMAALAGLDLSRMTGSGAGGRVMKVDVERLLRASGDAAAAPTRVQAPPVTAAPGAPSPVPLPDAAHTDRPLTAMRRVTAQRTAEAKRSAPHFYLEIECAVDRLLALRVAARGTEDAARGTEDAGGPTVNDVVVRAAALALKAVPLANSAWTGDAVRVYDQVDLAVAVSTPAGLVTPVVRGADTKSLAVIAADLRTLAADARGGRLHPADYQGGTCTISNLGMFGVSSLYAILNPPQSCILGIGAIVERPVVRNGAVGVGSMMTVTLSADHRAIDGATGAELLRAFKGLIEDPAQLFT